METGMASKVYSRQEAVGFGKCLSSSGCPGRGTCQGEPPYARYWNVQFIDASSNVFGYMGSRLGNEDSDRTALLVPQDYQQDTGERRIIRATSNKVWLVYRFHVVDANDIAAAVQVQNNLELITSQASPGS